MPPKHVFIKLYRSFFQTAERIAFTSGTQLPLELYNLTKKIILKNSLGFVLLTLTTIVIKFYSGFTETAKRITMKLRTQPPIRS